MAGWPLPPMKAHLPAMNWTDAAFTLSRQSRGNVRNVIGPRTSPIDRRQPRRLARDPLTSTGSSRGREATGLAGRQMALARAVEALHPTGRPRYGKVSANPGEASPPCIRPTRGYGRSWAWTEKRPEPMGGWRNGGNGKSPRRPSAPGLTRCPIGDRSRTGKPAEKGVRRDAQANARHPIRGHPAIPGRGFPAREWN